MSVGKQVARAALDQAEELAVCLEAVTDLLTPGLALDDTGKDKLATLLGVLLRQQAAAIGGLRAALIERGAL